jgi:integrase
MERHAESDKHCREINAILGNPGNHRYWVQETKEIHVGECPPQPYSPAVQRVFGQMLALGHLEPKNLVESPKRRGKAIDIDENGREVLVTPHVAGSIGQIRAILSQATEEDGLGETSKDLYQKYMERWVKWREEGRREGWPPARKELMEYLKTHGKHTGKLVINSWTKIAAYGALSPTLLRNLHPAMKRHWRRPEHGASVAAGPRKVRTLKELEDLWAALEKRAKDEKLEVKKRPWLRVRAMLMFLSATGGRCQDLCNNYWTGILPVDNGVSIRLYHQKTGTERRSVFLSERHARAIEEVRQMHPKWKATKHPILGWTTTASATKQMNRLVAQLIREKRLHESWTTF